MAKVRKACVTSDLCASKAELHEYLRDALGFPDYYGKNLSALADCLAESCVPLNLRFEVDADTLPTDMQAYLLRLVQVCAREALANENVVLCVSHGATSLQEKRCAS